MRILIGFVVVVVVGLIVPAAHAVPVDSYHITAGSGLQYLEHDYYYRWGINTPWDVSRTPTSATLTFTDLADWRVETNRFYLDLLPTATLGITSGYDNEAMTDWFVTNGVGTQIAAYSDLPATPTTLVYNFTSDELNTLKTYAADGRFGIGIDPDCHFSNCGVSLDVCFAPGRPPVPLPPAVLLAIPGFAAVWAVRRAQRRA